MSVLGIKYTPLPSGVPSGTSLGGGVYPSSRPNTDTVQAKKIISNWNEYHLPNDFALGKP